MKKNLFLSLGLSTVAFLGQAFAGDCSCGCSGDVQPTPQGYDQGYGINEGQLPAGYNAPSRIAVDGCWDAFASASFIYWLPIEKGLEFASTSEETLSTNPMHTTLHGVSHEYKPGFKVGFGFNVDHDNWVVDLDYTRLHCNHGGSARVDVENGELTPYFLQKDNSEDFTFTNASGHWNLRMDILELNISRPFYNGRHLTLNPVAGIRGGWIGQHYKAKYVEEDNGDVHFKSKQHSWLVGPQAGINAKWLLGMGFRFFGDMMASIFYQKFNLSTTEHQAEDPVSDVYMKSHNDKGVITPYFDFNVGIGYGSYFGCNKWHFDLAIGYEFQIYWEQNHIRYLKNDLNSSQSLEGFGSGNAANLLLHGLTVTARLDF